MPSIFWEAILPKKPVVDEAKLRKVVAEMQALSFDIVQDIAEYPVQRQGVRYIRTGHLGRTWVARGPLGVYEEAGALISQVGNKTEYASTVQGFKTKSPQQKAVFATYGWKSVEEVAKRQWAKHKPMIERALEGK